MHVSAHTRAFGPDLAQSQKTTSRRAFEPDRYVVSPLSERPDDRSRQGATQRARPAPRPREPDALVFDAPASDPIAPPSAAADLWTLLSKVTSAGVVTRPSRSDPSTQPSLDDLFAKVVTRA